MSERDSPTNISSVELAHVARVFQWIEK